MWRPCRVPCAQNWSVNVEIMGRNSFPPLSSSHLADFHETRPGKATDTRTSTWHFTKIRGTV